MSVYFTLPFDPTIYSAISDMTPTQLKQLIAEAYAADPAGFFHPDASPPDTSDEPRKKFLWGEIITDGGGNKTCYLRWFNPDTTAWEPVQLALTIGDGTLDVAKLDASTGLAKQVLAVNALLEAEWTTVENLIQSLSIAKIANGGVLERLLGTSAAGVNMWYTKSEVAALIGSLLPKQFADKEVTYNYLHWTALAFGTASGTDTYSLTILPNTSNALGDGNTRAAILWVKFTNANTAAAELTFNGQGPYAITKNGATPLEAGDIGAGSVHMLCWDGTRYQIIVPSKQAEACIYRSKAAGTVGQPYTTAGTPPALEVELTNESDPDNIVTLSGTGEFTLIAGTYSLQVIVPYFTATSGSEVQLVLEKTVGAVVEFQRGFDLDTDDNCIDMVMYVPPFAIASSTKYRILFYSTTSGTVGQPVNLNSLAEIGAQVIIRKLK